MTQRAPGAGLIWTALGAIYLIWGSTYLAIRVMVETIPPLAGAGVRFVLAGVAMLAVLAWRRDAGIGRAQLLWTAIVGTLLAAGGNGLVTVAEQDVPSGLAALLVASVPLWIVLYRALGGDRPARATVGGVAIGFVGVAILLLPGGRPDGVPLGPTLLVVLAAASWGFGSFLAQRVSLPADPLVSVGWQMLFGGLVLSLAAVPAGEWGDLAPGTFSADSLLALVYLVLVGSIVAFSAYAFLLQHAPISQVSTYAYVNPVIAVLLGAVFLDEVVATGTAVGTVLIVAAVAAIVRRESQLRETTQAPTVSACNRPAAPSSWPSSAPASSSPSSTSSSSTSRFPTSSATSAARR